MTTYYVRKTGSDGAAGTSAGAAWATIGKALGATGISSGDTVYIGAGVYRETVTVAMTSATVETSLIGDVDGVQTGDAGEVVWSQWTSGDTAVPAAATLCTLNGRDFLTFKNITFVNYARYSAISGETVTSANITIQDCSFIGTGSSSGIFVGAIWFIAPFDTPLNLTIDRCRFLTADRPIVIGLRTSASGADYDANVTITNSSIITAGNDGVYVDGDGTSLTFRGGGVDITNCTIFGAVDGIASFFTSTTYPVIVTNCLIITSGWGGGDGLDANPAGTIVEDYNVIHSRTAYFNVTPGAHSVSNRSYSPLVQIGQESVVGGRLRPLLMPSAGSALLHFGASAAPSVDLLGSPRPIAARATVGAYERSDTFVRETTTVRTGSQALSVTGPGYHDFDLPVEAAATTVTVYVRWDATYAGTKPAMRVVKGTEIGVADATSTASGSSDAWELLTLNFTPTAAGIVTIRFVSSDTNGAGKMFVDDYNVS